MVSGGSTGSWPGAARSYLSHLRDYPSLAYTLLLYCGCVIGIFTGSMVAAAGGIPAERFVWAAVVLLIPALIGARLWFVVQNPDRLRNRPFRIFRPWRSGAARDGGLLLSFPVSGVVLTFWDLSFWSFWDAASVAILVGTVFGRIGCLIRGCCAGRETGSLFGMWLPNHRREWRRRIPTPLLEAAWSLALITALAASRSTLQAEGALFGAALAGYALGRPWIAWTRETTDFHHAMRISVTALVFLVAAGAVTCLRKVG